MSWTPHPPSGEKNAGAKNFSPLQCHHSAKMSFNPEIHRRRSIRLIGYDYTSAGAYFITICASGKECLFGAVENGQMRLNDAGHIAEQCWRDIPLHFPHAALDEFAVMPNHVHGIVVLDHFRIGTACRAPTKMATTEQFGRPVAGSISTVVRSFKSAVTHHRNKLHGTIGEKIWQRNFYEHIIRNETELNGIREYIQNNPAQWELDDLHVLLQAESASTCPPA
ncbi:transposase [Candidatus Electronema sp. JM]|uniref:transposase n=1 Tax=Candidatus Electronema sp. JM TaxID=3401571 RepID=UPI003AA8E7F7